MSLGNKKSVATKETNFKHYSNKRTSKKLVMFVKNIFEKQQTTEYIPHKLILFTSYIIQKQSLIACLLHRLVKYCINICLD